MLFTDIVESSRRAVEVGDRAWRELLQRHHELVRHQLVRFRGREVDTAGDGFLASFDGPARGIRCAQEIVEGVRELGLEVRAGLHTGECELLDGKVAGIAVHTGARVASYAQPGEVLVSSTVKDLVAGSGLAFNRSPALNTVPETGSGSGGSGGGAVGRFPVPRPGTDLAKSRHPSCWMIRMSSSGL